MSFDSRHEPRRGSINLGLVGGSIGGGDEDWVVYRERSRLCGCASGKANARLRSPQMCELILINIKKY